MLASGKEVPNSASSSLIGRIAAINAGQRPIDAHINILAEEDHASIGIEKMSTPNVLTAEADIVEVAASIRRAVKGIEDVFCGTACSTVTSSDPGAIAACTDP